MGILKENKQFKKCECGCGTDIPTINKLGNPARFVHGHNVDKRFYDFNNPTRLEKIKKALTGRSRTDMKNNKYRVGIKPTNAFKKGEHRSTSTEFKKGHINSAENKEAVSKATKKLWCESEEYRKKCISAPRKRKKDTKLELKVRGMLDQLNIKYIPNKWLSFGHIGKKFGCFPDIRLPELNTVIFCDNEYWHSLKFAKERDKHQNYQLKKLGFSVIRLPGSKIKTLIREDLSKLLDNLA